MTDDTKGMDDIELITRWLNHQLPDDQADAVRTRLEQDAAFRELAAPLILVWSVPKHFERKPRPEGETARAWADFVKRTGFPDRAPTTVREEPRTID